MKQTISHNLPPELAKKAAAEAAKHYETEYAKYNPKTEWTSDTSANVSFRAKGISVTAKIDISPAEISVDIDVPFILRPFKRKAVSIVTNTVNDWIGRARSGEFENA